MFQSDRELLRCGRPESLQELRKRHWSAVLAVAQQLSVEDSGITLAEQAFFQLCSGALRVSFRADMYRAMKEFAEHRPNRKVVSEGIRWRRPDSLAGSMTVRAFYELPQSAQEVLWYSAVENLDPHQFAAFLGLDPCVAAENAEEARTSLTESWLGIHQINGRVRRQCRNIISQMRPYSQGALPRDKMVDVAQHGRHCLHCGLIMIEINDFASKLPLVLLPLFLGPQISLSLPRAS